MCTQRARDRASDSAGDCGCGLASSPTATSPITTSPITTSPITTSPTATATPGDAVPEPPSGRRVALGTALLARNDTLAARNREGFAAAGLPVVNLLSSPGSGKTALLESLGRPDADAGRLAVIVGDLATDNDARRLEAAGLAAVQITTGQACHLEAAMVAGGVRRLQERGLRLEALDLLVIENVGNLVCPAAYDLGESLRVVLLAVTEGEDKPLKYPAIFHGADLVVISKIDLAEVVGFDRPLARANIARVAPRARIFELSARSGAGIAAFAAALRSAAACPLAAGPVPELFR
jgi:hydrogenase nickel incorporation protein HypB